MKCIIKKVRLFSFLAVLVALVSCGSAQKDEPENDVRDFVVEVIPHAGIRTESGVDSYPFFEVRVVQGEDVDYSLLYSVDGGDFVSAEKLWVGETFNIDIRNDDYGEHSLKLTVSRADNLGPVKTTEYPVWMRGAPIISIAARAASNAGEFKFGEVAEVQAYVTDMLCTEVVVYPRTTRIEPEVLIHNGHMALSDDATWEDGTCRFSLDVISAGEEAVEIILHNGELSDTLRQQFICVYNEDHDYSLSFEAELESAIVGCNPRVRLRLGSHKDGDTYEAGWSIDGGSRRTIGPVSFDGNDEAVITVPHSLMDRNTHNLTVYLTSSRTGHTVSRSMDVSASIIPLDSFKIIGTDGMGINSLSMALESSIYIQLELSPENATILATSIEDESGCLEAVRLSDLSFQVKAVKCGSGVMSVKILNERLVESRIDVYVYAPVFLSLYEDIDEPDVLSFSAINPFDVTFSGSWNINVQYRGKVVYKTAEGTKDNPIEYTHTDYTEQRTKTISYAATNRNLPVVNMKKEYDAIRGLNHETKFWADSSGIDWKKNYIETDYVNYTPELVSVSLLIDNTGYEYVLFRSADARMSVDTKKKMIFR